MPFFERPSEPQVYLSYKQVPDARFGSVAVLSVVMTVAGTLVPAIRALKVDPITAIRAE